MLINADNVCVVVFNMQLELVPLLHDGTQLLNNCCWLVDLADTLKLKGLVIEHSKLGASSQALKEVAGEFPYLKKMWFDFTQHEEIVEVLRASECRQFVLAGAETHVCLMQSAFGLKRLGYEVSVMSDVSSSRNYFDHQQGLAALLQDKVRLLSKEMFFFECIRNSEIPQYLDLAMKFLDGRYIR